MIVNMSKFFIIITVQLIIVVTLCQCQNKISDTQCSDNEFNCNNTQCILKTQVCDGKYDCRNRNDETYELCENKKCKIDEFSCSNGACVPIKSVCNRVNDCADGSDEADCNPKTVKCENQWMKACLSGDCISLDKICDGFKDCPDNSDETYSVCSNFTCPGYLFTCKYGACVDPSSRCNGVPDCIDYSDEINCGHDIDITKAICGENHFQCNSGLCIKKENLCNGIRDCDDGSDETYRQCKNTICAPKIHRCKYGACADQFKCVNSVQPQHIIPIIPLMDCLFPQQPANGVMKTSNGKTYNLNEIVPEWTILTYSCNEGYSLGTDQAVIVCANKKWTNPFPTCKKICPPLSTRSHEIECHYRQTPVPCNESYTGTIANVKCKDSFELKDFIYQPYNGIECGYDGTWSDKLYDCNPICGTLTPKGQPLVVNGFTALKGEFPWHAGLYFRETKKDNYEQRCGGTIITENIILSAAHCFWDFQNDKPNLQIKKWAVAVGKLYRDWYHNKDRGQKYQIKQVILPKKFQAADSNFAYDIAIIILKKTIKLSPFVRPACIDWSKELYQSIFVNGSLGLMAGWGSTEEFGPPAEILKAVKLPYIDYETCFQQVPETFRPFITFDTICAGYRNGTSSCTGDSGGGLAFKKYNRYFIGAVVSANPGKGGRTCDSYQYGTFTSVPQHLSFIMEAERENRL